jgi:hypothetical protein
MFMIVCFIKKKLLFCGKGDNSNLIFIWPNGYRREEFLKAANQKQESPMAAMFVNGSGRNEQ